MFRSDASTVKVAADQDRFVSAAFAPRCDAWLSMRQTPWLVVDFSQHRRVARRHAANRKRGLNVAGMWLTRPLSF
jgi:hypothetical protein